MQLQTSVTLGSAPASSRPITSSGLVSDSIDLINSLPYICTCNYITASIQFIIIPDWNFLF